MAGQSIAQSGINSLESGRILSVEGQILDDQSTGKVTVKPQNTLPGTEQESSFSTDSGNYSKNIKLFPGLNLLEAATETGSRSSHVYMRVDPPRLRITLSWSGGNQDYDLYVNSIYYGNRSAGGGTLDNDWTNENGPVTETVLYSAAPAGLYRIYVNHFANHSGTPRTTYVKIYLNEKQIYSGSHYLSQPNGGTFGNGAGVWNVATVLLHSGGGSGGYVVDENGFRDIAKQGAFVGISPRTSFNVSTLTANGGTSAIYLPINKSVQFKAKGTVNYGSGNQQTDQTIIEQYTVQTISGSGVVTIDGLGVLTAVSPGHVRVGCNGFSGSPIDVYALKIDSIQMCKPESGVWDMLPWGQVLLEGDDMKLKINLTPGVSSLSDFISVFNPTIELRKYSVSSSGAQTTIINTLVPVTTANSTLEGNNEIRVTISSSDVLDLSLVSKDEDSTDEKCSVDSQSATTGASHRRDSDSFDSHTSGIQRGLARGSGNPNAFPPEGEFTTSFIQSAGALNISATIIKVKGDARQIQEQCDLFYYSGHGNHSNGKLASLAGPSDVDSHWDDIDKAIIAGCAVLDVNDYNNRFSGADHTASPGKLWATTAPDNLLGYNWIAPLDDNVGDPDFTKDIIDNYLTSTETGDVNKWMWANRDKAAADFDDYDDPGQRPWNACILTRSATEWIYWYWDFNILDQDGKPTINHKHESEW